MAFKPIESMYQAKNNATGLTDVKAQVFKNGTGVAVGASAIVLTELDAVHAPGIYRLNVSSATLVTLGFASGDVFEAEIDSATKPAPAPFKVIVNSHDIDDNYTGIAAANTTLGTPAGASVSADVAAVKTDTAAIKVDLESGANSLNTILSSVQSLQNATMQSGVAYVLPNLLIPSTGSNTYKIPITIMDSTGASIDPTSNLVTVGVLNASGTDRGSYLTGSSGTPATVAATRASMGQYYVMVSIPSTAIQEDLNFSIAYASGSKSYLRYGQSQTIVDANSSGFALQTTLLATQTTVNTIQTELTNGTYGLSAIESILANGTSGLAAIETSVSGVLSEITSNVEGASFSSSTDSLHAISSYMSSNLFSGGRAV